MKSKGSKKKDKKKSNRSKKDEWTHEGGVNFNDGALAKEFRGPRRTQERDERIRRGLAKVSERQSEAIVRSKLARKIDFKDFLFDAKSENIRGDKLLDLTKKQVKLDNIESKPRRSPKTIIERLQRFVNSSSFNTNKEEYDDDNVEKEEYVNEADEEFDDEKDESGEIEQMNALLGYDVDGAEGTGDAYVGDGETHNENEEPDEDPERDVDSTDSCFAWFFSSEDCINDVSKPKVLRTIDDIEVVGMVRCETYLKPITTLRNIPGLNKLWRSRVNEALRSSEEMCLIPYFSCYMDAFVDLRNHQNDNKLLRACMLHVCVHAVRTRAKVLKHNYKLRKREETLRLQEQAKTEGDRSKKSRKQRFDNLGASTETRQEDVADIQDQGFCRPRILILCPFRNTAKCCVELLVDILGPNTTLSSAAKFAEEFDADDDSDEGDSSDDDGRTADDGNQISSASSSKKAKGRRSLTKKPVDWKATFKGNIDDDFKVGLQINPGQGKGAGADKGVYVRLYSDFYQSDIILASPLGLRLVVETSKGQLNFDFLSSIELVILHQADVMYMQNWEHVEYILSHVNRLPETDHETDFSRVRPYFLDGAERSAQHRQMIFTSSFTEPDMQTFFRTYARSKAGSFKLRKTSAEGAITQVLCSVKQIFLRVSCASFEDQEDARFSYFCDHVLSNIIRIDQPRTLIVAPSYLSFVRIRNELIRREANAAYVSEYSRDSEISRGRSRFFHGEHRILLYSGRAHFFRRFFMRGALHVIFYSPPEYAHFYPEIVNMLTEAESIGLSAEASCVVLFTKYDRLALERVIGTERSRHMVTSNKATFMFK